MVQDLLDGEAPYQVEMEFVVVAAAVVGSAGLDGVVGQGTSEP